MRLFPYALCLGLIAGLAHGAYAAGKTATAATGSTPGHIEVTADQTLEWYQDQRLYVARGNAKAVRNDMTVEADLLTAHERDMPAKQGKPGAASKGGAAVAPENTAPASQAQASSSTAAAKPADDNSAGDIDKMTAEGHVHVTTSKANIYGEHGVYDLIKHVAYLTGNGLKYQTPQDVVTARDSLEYWEDTKIAVARGNAVGISGDRHVEGDVLTAQFRDMPNGKSQMHTLTAEGHVVIITPNDVSRGERAVYDVNRNIAILTGNVRITRNDGTQLTGDVGEVDFATNQSRLLNEGKGTRVRALLVSKSSPKTGSSKQNPIAASTTGAQTATTAP
jgi:lipopolysaccharide export system protein LptA